MHSTNVILKNGDSFSAPISKFRPEEGLISFIGVRGMFHLKDIESAVTPDERVGYVRDDEGKVVGVKLADVDELARARTLGWDGS